MVSRRKKKHAAENSKTSNMTELYSLESIKNVDMEALDKFINKFVSREIETDPIAYGARSFKYLYEKVTEARNPFEM